MSNNKYSLFARLQHLILPLFGGGLHMCICAYVVVRVSCVASVFAYAREEVMFEVYGGESESMSDEYGSFLVFLAIY